ncbi:MAG: hypothetical protein H7834_15985 [Magnetococcus sp. YQC-9]
MRIDSHVITQEEYEEIPELSDAFFQEADEYFDGKLISRGRLSDSRNITTARFTAETIPSFPA